MAQPTNVSVDLAPCEQSCIEPMQSDGQRKSSPRPALSPLSYVDFIPKLLEAGTFTQEPKYEHFNELVVRANEWLVEHPSVLVKTCETFEAKLREDFVDTDMSVYADYGEHGNFFVRCLRLWVTPRASPFDAPQSIAYVNLVPEIRCLETTATDDGNPGVDNLIDTIAKFNCALHDEPLPGKLLNVESLSFKLYDIDWISDCGHVNPDETYIHDKLEVAMCYLTVIRVFYEIGSPIREELDCVDFVPDSELSDAMFAVEEFEKFSTLVKRAKAWLRERAKTARLVNVQSLFHTLRASYNSDEPITSTRSLFQLDAKCRPSYVRFLRMYLAHPIGNDPQSLTDDDTDHSSTVSTLMYKTFAPRLLDIDSYEFQTMSETMKDAMTWMREHSVFDEIICAETVVVHLYEGNQQGDTEATYNTCHSGKSEDHMYALRVYLKGDYDDQEQSGEPSLDGDRSSTTDSTRDTPRSTQKGCVIL